MVFEDFAGAHQTVLWSVFAVALVMGAVVNKTNFCTMGAVSDLVNIGDSGRMRAWLLAMAVAILGVVALEGTGAVSLDGTMPPYRGASLPWLEYLLGGVLFGIGMTLASGCGNKCLVRIGGGNIKSVVVFAIIGVVAYFMVNPFPGTDQTLFSLVFYPWTNPTAVNLSSSQDLGSLTAGMFDGDAALMRMILGLIVGLALVAFVFKSAAFRSSFDNILGGLVVGIAVLGAWYITAGLVSISSFGDSASWSGYVQEWDFLSDGSSEKPASVGVQSFTFINPMGETLGYAASGFTSNLVTFGVVAVFGVIAGSLLWALLSRSFRWEWFSSWRDFGNHAIGAVLMGVGGVLAMGCTIGQAVTGASTLALGSFIAFGGIVLGSALTMKVQYYKMVYEDEATFGKAVLTSLVDMRLLPGKLRKLEAV